jgi:hypothetical protein
MRYVVEYVRIQWDYDTASCAVKYALKWRISAVQSNGFATTLAFEDTREEAIASAGKLLGDRKFEVIDQLIAA